MLRRLVPRRLAHGEAAELVDHLGELRHRVVVGVGAFVPAFALAFAFHERIVELLVRPLPEGRQLVTFGVAEPFTTSVKVSAYAAIALVLPVLLWQLWGFLAPAIDAGAQRAMGVFLAVGTGLFALGVAFSYIVVLPAALDFLTSYDEGLYDIQIRASYYYSFVALALLASGLAFELPVFVLALVRLGVLTSDRLRRNRRSGWVAMVAFAILLPTVDPVSLALEVAPLLVLFELSIHLSVVMERRWFGERPQIAQTRQSLP